MNQPSKIPQLDIFSLLFFILANLGALFISPCLGICAADQPQALIEQIAKDRAKELVLQKCDKMGWRLSKLLEPNIYNHAQATRNNQPVTVIIHLEDNASKDVIGKLASLGIGVESKRGNRLQVQMAKDLIHRILSWKQVNYISLPSMAKPQEIVSDAVTATGARAMQLAGFNGKGVKIGIIDLGFFGYSLLLGSELPASITKKNFRHDICGFSFCPTQRHGTAVAEIIHDLAPKTELYMASVGTADEFMDAIDWLESKGVDIVSCSLGYWLCGPVDGRGWCSQKAGEMRSKGILPIFAAGNAAKNHWYGPNKDDDGDSLIEINDQSQAILFASDSYQEITVAINWNDWGEYPENASSDQDIDLLVLSPIPYSTEVETVAASFNTQSGRSGQMPIESVTFYAEPERLYYIFLINSDTNKQVTVHLYLESEWDNEITPYISAQSILQPADSPDVLAVGASDISGNLFEYSSHGPTWNGTIKPDITGLSGLSTLSIPSFSGTSAATPTVAGVAALLKEAHQDWGPNQLQAALELLSRDIYKPGQDNGSGCGLVDISKATDLGTGPVTGFWWNPQKDGTGFSIERNQGMDYLAIYTYEPHEDDSVPIWFAGFGKAFSSMTGPLPLLAWTGWPIGNAPGDFFSSYVAEISLLYLDEMHGLLQIRDTTTNAIKKQPIERFVFTQGGLNNNDNRTGWWWDPALPGNGIFIDFQSDMLFGAWYHYNENGLPRWWTFSGEIPKQGHGTLNANILQWHGGPCLSCPQIKPASFPIGTVDLEFQNGEPSILKWHTAGGLSGIYNLERFPFYLKAQPQ